jgi:hypothetical protein
MDGGQSGGSIAYTSVLGSRCGGCTRLFEPHVAVSGDVCNGVLVKSTFEWW